MHASHSPVTREVSSKKAQFAIAPGDEDNSWDASLLSNLTNRESQYDNSKKTSGVTNEVPVHVTNARRRLPSLWCGCAGRALEPEAEPDFDNDAELRDPRGATYVIDKMIGEGGFSKVLMVRAKDGHRAENDSAVFAAKIIPKAHLKMAGDSFVRATMLERNILGDVGHPFILKLYHAFQEKDRLVLIVDFCVGGSVHYHVNLAVKQTGKGLDELRAGFYVAEIALALAYLHKHGIVHRDLKLENVLLKASGHIVICDFGTSKLLRPVDDTKKKLPTHTKSIIGTPAYMAPEMLLEQPYNFSVDWWALGVTLFTCLRAKLPFDGGRNNDEEKMLWRIVKSRPRYDPNWTEPMHDILQALLQKLPKTRILNLDAFKQAELYKYMDWDALESERLPPPYVPQLKSKSDTAYIPHKYVNAALPSRTDVPYKKGDSMKKLFRDFSHRSSLESL